MSTISVTKGPDGKLCGAGTKGAKAYARFIAEIAELGPGEIATFSYWIPRSPALHGYFFVILEAVLDQQEQFEDDEGFRKWVATGAGHCDYLPGPQGKMVAIPKSIAWHELDDVEFQEFFEKAVLFLRSPTCTGFLWPHLSLLDQGHMIEGILAECEVKREEIRARRGKSNA